MYTCTPVVLFTGKVTELTNISLGTHNFGSQVAQNVFITFYLGCMDVIKKHFEKNIFKTFV